MLTTLKALRPSALAVFNHLTHGLDLGGHRKLDNASGTFVAVSVERITERHYSIAHYFEQNGDLMADPEMTFFKSDDGAVYPCTFQQDNLAMYRIGLDITPEGVIEHTSIKEQHEQALFADDWMRNIADQQGLKIEAPAGVADE